MFVLRRGYLRPPLRALDAQFALMIALVQITDRRLKIGALKRNPYFVGHNLRSV